MNTGAIAPVEELVDAAEAVLADRPVRRVTAVEGAQGALLRLSPAQRETTRLLASGLTRRSPMFSFPSSSSLV